MVILRLKNKEGAILSTVHINSPQVAAILQHTGEEDIIIKMTDGSVYRVPNQSVIDAIEKDIRRSNSGGGGGGGEYDRPTTLNEVIDIVMDLVNRDDEEASGFAVPPKILKG